MNYSKWCSRWGFPARVSNDPTRSWRGGLSDTGHVRRTARFAVQRDVAMTWQFATSGYAKVRLESSGLRYTSSVWPWSGTPKSMYSYRTENWLTSMLACKAENRIRANGIMDLGELHIPILRSSEYPFILLVLTCLFTRSTLHSKSSTLGVDGGVFHTDDGILHQLHHVKLKLSFPIR